MGAGQKTVYPAVAAAALALGLALAAAPASAHVNTRAYGQLALGARGAELTLFARYDDWDQAVGAGLIDANRDGRVENSELTRHAPVVNRWLAEAITGRGDGEACPAAITGPTVAVRGRELYLRSVLAFDCGREVQRFTLGYDLFTRLHPGHKLIASVRTPGGEATHIFATDPRGPAEHTVGASGPPGRLATLFAFIVQGVKHILIGYDHVLFLLALLLASASRRELLFIITAFTAAHSVTLAAAILNVARPPASVVEPAIALSVVLVAADNLWTANRPAGRFLWLRLLATFGLGLLHGFGFAGVLLELELDRGALVTSLVGFNLGVELGQLALVLVAYPALTWLRRQPFQLLATRATAMAILTAGMIWFTSRLGQLQ